MTNPSPALAAGLILLATGAAAADPPAGAIHMSQVGFGLDGPKRATVTDPSTAPLSWRVVGSDGAVLAEGVSRVWGDDAASGTHAHVVDFDGLRAEGNGYRLLVGPHQSRPFRIVARPHDGLAAAALAFFYQQRSGVPILAEHVERPDLARPAAHAPDRAGCFRGPDQAGDVWPGCDHELDVSGGWYDAGDHGKYVVNGGISVWTLLNAWERGGRGALHPAFADGGADIPEAGNGVSDLLDEARFEMEFLLRMQVADGTRLSLPVGVPVRRRPRQFREVDAGGMAHHKVHDANWTPLPTAPHEDRETRYLHAPSTAATLNLAAAAAQAARVWRDIDPAFARRCLLAAERALRAARRHPDIYPIGGTPGGGGYGDNDLSDEFYWATAELYATTGDPGLSAALRESPHFLGGPRSARNPTDDVAWASVGALGTLTLAFSEVLSAADRDAARRAIVESATAYRDEVRAQAHGAPFAGTRYDWGSNGDLMNRAMVLGTAWDLTGESAYRDAVIAALDYVLGRNPLDQSYVSGFGDRPLRHPHHRFWAPSAGPRWPAPPAGALSGGPNNSAMSDPVAAAMRGKCAPQACWVDHVGAYSLNEVAINWNAPLVWVAAFADEP